MPGLSHDVIREALRIARESGFRTVRLKAGDDRFRAELSAAPVVASPTPTVTTTAVGPAPEAAPAPILIHSPAVGIFRPIDPPLQVGDKVSPDQLVGTVAALGLANDVLAKVSGEIAEVLIEAGQSVDYHRPLFRVTR